MEPPEPPEPPPLPPSLAPLVAAYLAGLAPLGERVVGVYLCGSLALAAFEASISDVDAVVLTQGTWTSPERDELGRFHAALNRAVPLARRLDVVYVSRRDLGRGNDTLAPYPVAREGRFRGAGYGDLNAVTWWLLKHRSIPLLGPSGAALPFEVAWEEVRAAMRHNLDGYWAGKAARPHLFLSDYWVGFAVATLCRILTTLEDGELVAKTAALARWRTRLPDRWRSLIDEAWRIRHDPRAPSRYRTRGGRMRATLAFVAYARERGAAGVETGATPRPEGRVSRRRAAGRPSAPRRGGRRGRRRGGSGGGGRGRRRGGRRRRRRGRRSPSGR